MKTTEIIFICCLITVYVRGTVKATDCPDRWVAFEGSCYLFGHDLIHFTEAEEYCRQHSATLVHVETKEENMFLRDFLRDFKSADYWMGMTDETTEGIWKWYGTDKNVEYFDWGPSEPQNAHNEDCAVFGDTIDYTWADVQCATNRKALCEMQSEDVDIIG
ncbi:perlucin-like protein [Mercenaria mercenaria]|uniref:perlucin-like protein n=1 Tax=Mercenaria mercenaria TaxID=6596 RepID=UPI001E1D2CFB|nr:perlucin-like protein [Mercenaria mercenaria]